MRLVPEIAQPTPECPEPQLWNCYDAMSAEAEVLEFLFQLVRTIKPKLMVETGTFLGLAACYIGRALKQNGRGKLVTCELDAGIFRQASQMIGLSSVSDVIEMHHCSSLDLQVQGQIDILFCDSEPSIRSDEIRHFWDQVPDTGLIIVHDVNSGDHSDLRQRVLDFDRNRQLSVVLLPTPRGLAICQKREGLR
jgi:predicted O-methyltransferase YrrM